MIVQCEAKVCCLCRKNKKDRRRQQTDTRSTDWQASKKRERRQTLGRPSTMHSAMFAKIICNSANSRRIPLCRKGGKCIAKLSFANEFKFVTIEVLVRNDGCVNSSYILHLDCSCELRDYWFVLLIRRIECWVWLSVTVGYMRSDIFSLFALQR